MNENFERIALVGNGINDASKIEWTGLLNYLQQKKIKIPGSLVDLHDKEISPTIFFEYFNAFSQQKNLEPYSLSNRQLENLVCEYVEDKSNFIKKLWKKYNKVLTVNFDDNLILSSDLKKMANNKVLQQRYDFEIDNQQKKIYFIHGFYKNPSTICLGFDKYCSLLKRIQDFIVKNYPNDEEISRRKSKNMKNKKEKSRSAKSWIDFFFMENVQIDILGFSLSQSEIDIWWILNRRMQVRNRVNNKICYYDLPVINSNGLKNTVRENKHKILKTMDIEVVEIGGEEELQKYDADFYSLCLKK